MPTRECNQHGWFACADAAAFDTNYHHSHFKEQSSYLPLIIYYSFNFLGALLIHIDITRHAPSYFPASSTRLLIFHRFKDTSARKADIAQTAS